MQRNYSLGIMLALATAIISGISVFINGIAVNSADPIVYTIMKNSGVLLFLFATVFAFKEINNFRNLTKKQWATLVLIGIIGGSIPFALFFWGLKLGGAVIGSFIYRSLFIFAGVFGYLLLKEKPERNDIIAGVLLLVGNAILLSGELTFGFAQLLVLGATVLWALEYTISRKILADLQPRTVMVSRMFFGSIVLSLFVFGSGTAIAIDASILPWLGLTALLLFGFVITWYTSLKYIPVFKATVILALGGIITTVLNVVFLDAILSLTDLLSILLILTGSLVAMNALKLVKKINYLIS
ncbi:MAG: DMT family transporter [Candidatus Micrarchaeota archaeon]